MAEQRKKPSIGGIVGHAGKGAKIENCHFEGTIRVKGSPGEVHVGGIAGSSEGAEIVNSTSRGSIEFVDQRFEELRQKIRQEIEDGKRNEELVALVDQLQSTRNTTSFSATYKQFISLAGDHMSVVAPFIPFLSGFIPG